MILVNGIGCDCPPKLVLLRPFVRSIRRTDGDFAHVGLQGIDTYYETVPVQSLAPSFSPRKRLAKIHHAGG
ncbi:MAG TPA: hypothetical protein VEA39_05070 [Methylophilaceae bacterium]|nr:hypothetical protein [Methylophilaceae bacterium]